MPFSSPLLPCRSSLPRILSSASSSRPIVSSPRQFPPLPSPGRGHLTTTSPAWSNGRALATAAGGRPKDQKEGTAATIDDVSEVSSSRFYFEAGYALFAKRPSKPFPPPFFSAPSSSFSDPLSTHNRSRIRRQYTQDGDVIRGVTNGDDAILVTPNLIVANDGVGAWAQKEKGHAALWSRLILHFWSTEAERNKYGMDSEPDLAGYLSKAFELTKEATSEPNEWLGTTTASGAMMHQTPDGERPLLVVTQLGDSQIIVIRPKYQEVIFKTAEQWHWFDCPRQLGTNSPDTPENDAITDKIEIEEGDIILAMSDGVPDNLWEHEVVENVAESVRKADFKPETTPEEYADGMKYVARELVRSAMTIAQDPFAESPFMERAIEEGLPTEGGKLDDISVVAAICRRRPDQNDANTG